MELTQDDYLLLYRNMVRGRKFDEKQAEIYYSAATRVWGFHPHLGIGQEALGAGGCSFLRPDDYLVKIAQQEHDDYFAWRRIYNRNREDIGENPNLIYPYHEIRLSKLETDILRRDYTFSVHVVVSGETLWSIAGDKYGDPIAWIVLFLDNRQVIGPDAGKLEPGMELQVRSGLWAQ